VGGEFLVNYMVAPSIAFYHHCTYNGRTTVRLTAWRCAGILACINMLLKSGIFELCLHAPLCPSFFFVGDAWNRFVSLLRTL